MVLENGKQRHVSLYDSDPNEHWLEFGGRRGEQTSIAIFSSETRDAASKGDQVWLRGVEFHERQPWQGLAFPLSDAADFRHGRVGSLIVPHKDTVIGKAITNTGSWAPKDLDLFATLIAPGDVVLDIGANIGHHTVFFSSLVGDTGKVFGFEPQLEIFRFASANLAVNGCRNTTLMQGCLGRDNGEIRMAPISYDEVNNFGALSVASSRDAASGENVPVWTLDGLIDSGRISIDQLDFMKIDVQSFELFVLQGALKAIGKYRPKIFLEVSPHWMKLKGYDYLEIYKLLGEFGYDFEHFDESAQLEDGIRQWSGQITEEWDVLCLPPASPLSARSSLVRSRERVS